MDMFRGEKNFSKAKAADEVLGDPKPIEFSESAEKARAKLLVLASVASINTLFGVTISEDAAIFGFTFEGLDSVKITTFIFFALCYLWIHFLFLSYECYKYWRFRITGYNEIYPAAQTPNTSKTMYSWWAKQQDPPDVEDIINQLPGLVASLKKVEASMDDESTVREELRHLNISVRSVDALTEAYRERRVFTTSDNVKASLYRFDEQYKRLLFVENFRWFWFDFFMPALFGGVMILLLVNKLLPFWSYVLRWLDSHPLFSTACLSVWELL